MSNGYGGEQALALQGLTPKRLTMLERLQVERAQLADRLVEIDRVLGMFKAEPRLTEILEQLSKVTGFGF